MTDLRKAAEMALEALIGLYETPEFAGTKDVSVDRLNRKRSARESIAVLRQALAVERFSEVNQEIEEAMKQEPVAWVLYYNNEHGMPMRETFYAEAHMEFHKSHNETQRGLKCQVVPLYTAPPKREWVGLTDEDYAELLEGDWGGSLIKAVEAKLKEKNG